MSRNKSAGFTLLEVLIALVILAIAFSTSFLSLSTATRHLITLHDKTAAEWVGLNVVGKAQLGLVSATGANGSEKMFTTNWNWNLSAYPTESPLISRIVVSVHEERKTKNSTVVTGYVLRQNNS